MSPMLTALFAERPDCAFVISTHDVGLAHDNSQSKTVLLRNCAYGANAEVTAWDADLLVATENLDDQLLVEILGARRKVLFVEGEQQSLDKALYSLIFPDVSVIPKGSCRNVEQAAVAIRSAQNLHWIAAFGLIDNDNRSAADISELKTKGVYAVSSHSVESVLCVGCSARWPLIFLRLKRDPVARNQPNDYPIWGRTIRIRANLLILWYSWVGSNHRPPVP